MTVHGRKTVLFVLITFCLLALHYALDSDMPLSTTEVNKKTRPDLFYEPRMTPYPAWVADTDYVVDDKVTSGTWEYIALENHHSSGLFGDDIVKWQRYGAAPYTDGEGDHPVYDLSHEEYTPASGKGLKRRAKPKANAPDVPVDQTANARLQKITGKQHFFVDGYYDGDLIYTYEIKAEYGSPGNWSFQELDGTINIDNDLGVMTCTGVQGGFEWDIQIGFSELNKKWQWDVIAPGFTVRLVWIIDFTALGQQMIADGDIVLDHSDYTGSISDDQGVAQRTIIFEPDGIDATGGWVVDPYLSVDEQATTLNIKTDAAPFFEIEFDEGKGGVIDIWYQGDGGSTNYANSTEGLLDHFIDDGTERRQSDISDCVMTVLESNSLRTVARFAGTLTTNVDFEQYVAVYASGFIHFYTKVTNGTGGSITGKAGGVRISTDATNYASDTEIADNSSDSTPTYNTEYWFGQYASSLNTVVCAIIYASTQAQQDTYSNSANVNEYYNNSPTFADSTSYEHVCVLYIGDNESTEANIQANVDEKVDLVMTAPTDGSEITDMVIPFDLSSDGFTSDGARHLDSDSAGKITRAIDITRINYAEVIHQPIMAVGDSVDRLIEKWDCEATTTSVGSQTVTLNSADNTVDGVRGNGVEILGTDQPLFPCNTTLGNLASDTVTFHFWYKYTGSSPNTYACFFSHSTGVNELMLQRNAGALVAYVNGTLIALNSENWWTNILSDGNWHRIHLGYSVSSNMTILAIDGVMRELKTTDITDPTPTSGNICIGHRTGSTAHAIEGIIDEFEIIDGLLLPYGGGPHVSNDGSDFSLAHTDVTFHWAGSDTTPIGSNVTSNGDYTQDDPIGGKAFRNDAAGEYATAVTSGNIDASEGSLSFWFEPNAALGADCTLFYADAAFKVWWDDSDNDVVFTYNTDVLNMTTAFAAGDTGAHFVEIGWDASTRIYIKVDGELTQQLSGVDSAPTLDTNMYFTADDGSGTNRANVKMGHVTITDTIGTPQLGCVLGQGPMQVPRADF
jgi:hypothetical protein